MTFRCRRLQRLGRRQSSLKMSYQLPWLQFQGLLTKYQELAISGLAYGEILQSKIANTWILQTLQLVKHAAKNISLLKERPLKITHTWRRDLLLSISSTWFWINSTIGVAQRSKKDCMVELARISKRVQHVFLYLLCDRNLPSDNSGIHVQILIGFR